MKSYRSIFLSIFSATLLVFSFPMANVWLLVWIALVPFFLAIQDSAFSNTFLLGYLTGLVFYWGVLYWLNSIAVAATLSLVLYLSIYFGLFAVFAKKMLKSELPVFVKAVFTASGWAALEFIRANFLTGFGWASLGYSQSNFLPVIQMADITGVYGVSFVVVFVNVMIYEFFFRVADTPYCSSEASTKSKPSRELNILLLDSPLLEKCWRLARRIMTHLATIVRLLQNRLLNLLFCLLFIAIIFIYGFYQLSRNPIPDTQTSLKISLIQGNIPQSLKWDWSYRQSIVDKYFKLTKDASLDNPDLIIWPETSFPADFQAEPQLADGLFKLAKGLNVNLLVGNNRFVWADKNEYEKVHNSAFLIDKNGKIERFYDKLHLVPFGEYMPVKIIPKPLLKILSEKINMVGDFSAGEEYAVFKVSGLSDNSDRRGFLTPPEINIRRGGTGMSRLSSEEEAIIRQPLRGKELRFSVLICFEDVFPQLSRQFVKNGAQLLVNITNDGWYGISSAPFQHAEASIFRAVENRVPLVRSANTGLSIFIDEKGKVYSGPMPFTEGHKTREIFINTHPQTTFYNKYGDLFAIVCLALSIAVIINLMPHK